MATWTKDGLEKILNSRLLMEDGAYLLQQNSFKIVLVFGWDSENKQPSTWTKVTRS